MKEKFIILYLGINSWHEFEGTYSETIEYVKANRSYQDYGREGAVIITYDKAYEIYPDVKEVFYREMYIVTEEI